MALLGQERYLLVLQSALRHSFQKLAAFGFRRDELPWGFVGLVTTAGASSHHSDAAAAVTPHSHSSSSAGNLSTSSRRATADHTAVQAGGTAHAAYSTQSAKNTDTACQDKKVAIDLLSRLRQSLPSRSHALKEVFQAAPVYRTTTQHAVESSSHAMRPPRLVPRIRRKLQASPAEQPNVSQSITAAVNHVRQLQLEQQAASTFPVSNRSSNATDTFSELHEQLGAVLAEAQAQPHWNSNPEGFYTCLDNVELLFRQLFFKSPETDATSLTIQPTHDNLSQCINTILPVLLIPQQSPAPNIAGVTEFLHEMLQLGRNAIFHCMCQEPAILYLDVYSDLLPMHEYLARLQWDPAEYKLVIVRHPQLLLMPLSQLRKNVGYLLGQGISRQHILEMWKQRAGLMVESLKTLHGQMLALQLAGRPLQDLALPAGLRPAPVYGPVPHPAGVGKVPTVPTADARLAHAVAAVVGNPQAVYLYNVNRYRARQMRGVTQSLLGGFVAKAHLGGRKVQRLGEFQTLSEAARAYDAAVFKHAGKRAKLNFPKEYADRM